MPKRNPPRGAHIELERTNIVTVDTLGLGRSANAYTRRCDPRTITPYADQTETEALARVW